MELRDGKVVLTGDGGYTFTDGDKEYKLEAFVEDSSLKVYSAPATWWNDRETASGHDASVPGVIAVSLPMSYDPNCTGSPFPKLPWWVTVHVYSHANGESFYAPLWDVGPAQPPKAHGFIDLTPELYKRLGGVPGGNDDAGHIIVDYRIVNALSDLPAHLIDEIHALQNSVTDTPQSPQDATKSPSTPQGDK